MSIKTTIPTRLYVTVQYRQDVGADGLLGFASPYTKDAAFLKRKKTQDEWAYGNQDAIVIDPDDSLRINYAANLKIDPIALFAGNCAPRIVDNQLLPGFAIAKSVRRYGWNGSGNVKWRIADPRGFDLEISSENFASLLGCCTVINGVIREKCIWGRSGANNILLPESSVPYMEAINLTKCVTKKFPMSELNPGDVVDLLNTYTNGVGQNSTYLGQYKVLESTILGSYTDDNDGCIVANKQRSRYFFKNGKGIIITLGTPIVSNVRKADTPLQKQEVVDSINKAIAKKTDIVGLSLPIMVSETTIKLADVKVLWERDNFKFKDDFPTESGTRKFFRDKWDNLFYGRTQELWNRNQRTHKQVRVVQEGNKLTRSGTRSGHPAENMFEGNETTQFIKLVVEYNGKTYPVVNYGYYL